jgi:hypothetical protein
MERFKSSPGDYNVSQDPEEPKPQDLSYGQCDEYVSNGGLLKRLAAALCSQQQNKYVAFVLNLKRMQGYKIN